MRGPPALHAPRPLASPSSTPGRPPRGPPPPSASRRNKANDASLALAAERIAQLERENAKLRAELKGLSVSEVETAVDAPAMPTAMETVTPAVVEEAKPAVEAVAAAVAPPPLPPTTTTVSASTLEAGIVWPTPGEPFWERPPRTDEVVLQGK